MRARGQDVCARRQPPAGCHRELDQPFQRRWRRKSPPKVVALSPPTFSPRQKGLASRPTPREAVHKRGSRTIMKALRLVLVAAAAALAGLFLAVPAGATDTTGTIPVKPIL